jgi:WD40 repeat protein
VGRFFADHRRLAYSDRDRTVRILDCDSGLLADQKFTLSQDVDNIAISPDGQVLVTLTADATQFWEVGSGRELPTRPEVGVSLRPGTFRPDSSQYYQAGNAFGLVRYDPLNGKLSELPARGRLWTGHCMADPVERKVAVRFERVVGLYDMETGQPLCQPLPVVHSQTCDGRLTRQGFAAVTRDGDLTLWELNTNRFATIVLRHRAPVQLARFSTDGQRVVTASHDGSARIWDARTGQMVGGPMVHGDKVWSADFSPDGRRVVTASWDATARLWDATTGAPLSPPLPARHFVFHVEFSPDGSRFLAGGEDGMLRIYDAVTGGLLLELRETGQVYWAHFSPDGRMIVTRPFNANPKLWDARSGALIRELNEPPQRQTSGGVVTRGDFSRDGSWLALGSANRYATVWHLPEGKRHAVLNHLAVVRSACFSPDGQTVLTTSDDLTGQLWNARTGEASSPALAGQWSSEAPPNTGNSMRAAAIHPDGRRAVTGGSDAAARLWDLRNGLSLGEPVELAGSVMHAEFSPDGRRLLLACFDGSAHILSLPPIVERAPEWLAPLAEALVGQRSVARGAAEIVPPAALWNVCETIRRAPAQDEAARWARDCLGL